MLQISTTTNFTSELELQLHSPGRLVVRAQGRFSSSPAPSVARRLSPALAVQGGRFSTSQVNSSSSVYDTVRRHVAHESAISPWRTENFEICIFPELDNNLPAFLPFLERAAPCPRSKLHRYRSAQPPVDVDRRVTNAYMSNQCDRSIVHMTTEITPTSPSPR